MAPGAEGERSRLRLKAAERQGVASPRDFRGACSVGGGIRSSLRALPQGAHLIGSCAPGRGTSCDLRRAGVGRLRTRVGPRRRGPELVRLRGCGGPIGAKARRGAGVGLEHDGHLVPRNWHGLWGWPHVNLREAPGLLVLARGGLGIMVVQTFDASSDLNFLRGRVPRSGLADRDRFRFWGRRLNPKSSTQINTAHPSGD